MLYITRTDLEKRMSQWYVNRQTWDYNSRPTFQIQWVTVLIKSELELQTQVEFILMAGNVLIMNNRIGLDLVDLHLDLDLNDWHIINFRDESKFCDIFSNLSAF